MSPLLKGLIVGFSIAAPVGPIGVLCIRRSLTQGRLAGFVSGLGAATADVIYGVVAALGLTAISHALLAQRLWLQLGGGAFLVYLGVATLRPHRAVNAARPPESARLSSAYASTLGLTLTNPMTILSFLAIFAGLGAGTTSGAWPAIALVLGVFLGSAAWWLCLSSAAGWLGARLQHGGLRVLDILSGVVIAGFGVWQLAAAVQSLR
ncbi:MAG TPA: LysE family translocator [Opitutaceae bacterium]|nr:LysE family translocator [Opitutaceae bacterium]